MVFAVERLLDATTTLPTRPDPDTTGIPVSTPASRPLLSWMLASKLEDEFATTWAGTVGTFWAQGRFRVLSSCW